ncbi:hypothetical protein Trco_007382 [Trichoderma cornu-damae]|uniref:DUF6546 domain-containing protein n=1 Tax=Trichoderma cornu-damae TaxID=654480 RepID=A0A9P8TRI6_9HYPO|nr:hypothetical protein Trco_007382 [Trichoderma cornu-damae]
MILEFVRDSLEGGEAASYALVSREWHEYFEPCVFRRLTLSSKRIQEFEAIMNKHRRPFVQYIWFRFERSVRRGVTPAVTFRYELDHSRFTTAILGLFQILSEWPERGTSWPGIVLELTAFSAADPGYSMKDTVPAELRDVDLTVESDALEAIYNKTPGEMRGLTNDESREQKEIRSRLLPPELLQPMLSHHLPEVKLITDLTVRRQMHSSFFSRYMRDIVAALPKLEFLTYEPCFSHEPRRRTLPGASVVKDIIKAMPPSIRRFQVFEDFSALYGSLEERPIESESRRLLGELAADVSQDIEPEVICMSFITDAVHFFSDFLTGFIRRPYFALGWLNLTSLVLTSSVITPRSLDKIPPLLVAAARAAQHMPNLGIMELYYAGTKHGGIFTYIHDEQGSIICWESTWKWNFPLEVVHDWKKAAAVHGAVAFEFQEELIPRQYLRWPGSILSLLRTRETVVHPMTYANMMNGLNYM